MAYTPRNPNGQKTMANSSPVVVASDQTAFTVNMGTLNGIALETTVAKLPINQGATATGQTGPMVQGVVSTSSPTYTNGQVAPASLNQSGELRVAFTNTTVTNTAATALYVQAGTGATFTVTGPLTDAQLRASAVPVKESRSSSPATTTVASSATNVTILASNTNRLGATVFNDSTAALYLKLGATASTTSFTVKIAADGYYEVPFRFTGIIDGLWSTANGNAKITELS